MKFLFTLGVSLIVVGAVLAIPAPTAGAQCGADASSCKRCHQGDEAYPVNDLGQWHIDHADQDFCQLCHGGDKTTDDADAAHVDLFDPLGEKGAQRCQACHPADADTFTQTYVDVLATFDPSAPAESAAGAPTAAGTGYDTRNIALAGFAGFLTMVSGVIVWNAEHLGDKLRRRRED